MRSSAMFFTLALFLSFSSSSWSWMPGFSILTPTRKRSGNNNLSWNHRCLTSSRVQSTALQMSKGRGKKAEQRKETDILEFLEAPIVPKVDASGIVMDPNDDDLAEFVKVICKAADKRKAEDIRAIRVSKLTATTAFLVIVSGNSRPQNQAIAAAISDEVEQLYEGRRTKSGKTEGTADSGWILLDYGDVMVHVMTPKSRLFYDIEGIWSKGEVLDLSDILVPNNGVSGTVSPVLEEEDPFWS